jgi:hypothetical protein
MSLVPRRWRVVLLALLLVGLMHLWLGQAIWRQIAAWQGLRPAMPARLEMVFVKALLPQAPPGRPPAPRLRRLQAAAPAPPPIEAPLAALAPLPQPAELPALPEPEPVQAEAPAAAAAGPGPEWPLSTQLRYSLVGNYRGEVQGEAEVQWLREGARYQVHLDILIGARFAPLITRRMSSDGLLTPAGIAPQRYDEDTKVMFRERRRQTVLFDRAQQLLRLPNGRAQALPAGAQDAASQFVQLTWLFLTGRAALAPGNLIELPLALPRRLYSWRYEVLGEQELHTPMGPLAAWHLRPHVDAASRGSDLSAEVWLAPALQYLPVRLRIAQDEHTYLDLMLKSAPLQAAQ